MNSVRKHVGATVVVLLGGMALLFTLVATTGLYNFAGDVEHTSVVRSLLEYMRERSIEVRAANITVPDLNNRERISKGAGNYDAMCAQCHLAPAKPDTELSRGLYPSPPNLSKTRYAPAQAFWAIKHGIKTSGMPSWGKSMSDEEIWNMVAFLQRLPQLDASSYRDMVTSSSGHSHAGAGTSHSDSNEHDMNDQMHTPETHTDSSNMKTNSQNR